MCLSVCMSKMHFAASFLNGVSLRLACVLQSCRILIADTPYVYLQMDIGARQLKHSF